MIDNKTVHTPRIITTVVVQPTELPPAANEPVSAAPPPIWLIKMLRWIFPVAALLFIGLIAIPDFLKKWLWMRQLDYAGIFWTLFSVKLGLVSAAFAFAVAFLWVNVRWAGIGSGAKATEDSRHIATRSGALIIGLGAALFASGLLTQWDTFLRFRYGGSFGLADPIFGVDLGFYVFRLPWYELLQGSLLFVTGMAILVVGAQ